MHETALSPAAGAAEAARQRRAFVLRKLHSLSGVVPLGAFLVEHLWTNARALSGEEAFAHGVADIQALPALPLIEALFIFAPLAFHALYGTWLAVLGRPNVVRYPYTRNWLYVMQRASGVVALAFLAWHLWEFRIQKSFYGMRSEAFFGTAAAHLSSTTWGVPWLAVFYLVGLGAVVFHFANGLSGFCFSWGITVTRRAQRRAALAFGALGAALFLVGADTIVYFATGSRFGFR